MFSRVLVISHFLIGCHHCQASRSPITLHCWKDSMYIEVTNQFLTSRKIDVAEPKQLHFNGFPECHANVVQKDYSLTLYPPYKNCGTSVQVKSGIYSYSNEIVFGTASSNSKTKIFSFQCDYDKNYIVSSNFSLSPVIKTLNFLTSRGKFKINMGLYQRSDFNSKSMFGAKPSILVGTPVYVSVDISDVFQMSEIVSTIESCYATDDKDHSTQKLYHSLIVNRCASPSDDTVSILSNGENMSSRYRFEMFKWENDVEYFYLHCEVRICNISSELCTGIGPVCFGMSKERDSSITNSRKKREADDTTGNIITIGPVITKQKELKEETGVGSYKAIYGEIKKDQEFLKVYIYITVATGIAIAGIIIVIVVAVRKSRRNKTAIQWTRSPDLNTVCQSRRHPNFLKLFGFRV